MSDVAAEYVPLSALHGWDRNPRKNDHAVDGVVESVRRFGFAAPIVARRNGEVIAGHTRLKAALKLGLERVPVRYMDLSERDAHLLALADNRLAETAEWQPVELLALLSDFDAAEVALAGWSSTDLEQMATALLKGSGGPGEGAGGDEVPALPREPVTREGDVWQLGRHRLYCARGEAVDVGTHGLVVTDPPYGISVVKGGMVGADFGVARKGRYEPIAGDDEAPDVRWLLEHGKVVIVWGGNYFADQLPPTGGWLVWDKRGDSGIENTFADCELAWSNRTGPARVHRQLWNGMIREGERGERVHPTQKPVALMAWCLGFGEGDVLDPYAGSGSTLIAAEQLGRTCTAVELSPAYCDVIVQRWETLTSGKAQRA